MSRLTNKDEDNIYRISGFTTRDELIDKLAIYEDLEEQLGCPLEVMFKALKKGIFTKDLPSEKIVKWYGRLSNVETEWYLSDDNKVCVNIKGYKKTWWLKEDKSE